MRLIDLLPGIGDYEEDYESYTPYPDDEEEPEDDIYYEEE